MSEGLREGGVLVSREAREVLEWDVMPLRSVFGVVVLMAAAALPKDLSSSASWWVGVVVNLDARALLLASIKSGASAPNEERANRRLQGIEGSLSVLVLTRIQCQEASYE